jgi:hypothetical protein
MGCGSPSGEVGTTMAGDPTSASISGVTHDSNAEALGGVEICLYRAFRFGTDSAEISSVILPEATACTTSGANGAFRVSGALADDLLILTFRADGFTPTLRAITMPAKDVAFSPDETILMPAPLTFMGSAAEPGRGQLAFTVTNPGPGPIPSVSVKATPFGILTGFNGPTEPRYLDQDGSPSANATAGTRGGLVNVPSSLYLLEFTAPSATCNTETGLYGFKASGPDRVGVYVPVLNGYVSAPVGVSCTAVP